MLNRTRQELPQLISIETKYLEPLLFYEGYPRAGFWHIVSKSGLRTLIRKAKVPLSVPQKWLKRGIKTPKNHHII